MQMKVLTILLGALGMGMLANTGAKAMPMLNEDVPAARTADFRLVDSTPVEVAQVEAEVPVAQVTADNDAEGYGERGQNRWYLQAAAATDRDDDTFGLVGGGVSHFFAKGHSVNLELNGLAFEQPGDDAVGANLNFLVRSHWIRGENWSVYIDGGAGILGTTESVPEPGSTFNFTPQVGLGSTFNINDEQRVMLGVRWHHISNAGLYSPNPGLDTVMGYVAVDFPF